MDRAPECAHGALPGLFAHARRGEHVKNTIAAVASLALIAGSANAAVFSFATDTAVNHWTFFGGASNGQITNGIIPGGGLSLQVDDNGPLPTLTFATRLQAHYSLSYVGSTPTDNGQYVHNYLVSGQFTFLDTSNGSPLLTTSFTNGEFAVQGGEHSWNTTASLNAEVLRGASLSMFWNGDSLAGYGLDHNSSVAAGGLQFALTSINTSGKLPYDQSNPGVQLDQGMYPAQQWYAEGAYSATSNVPAPGSLVLGMFGLAAARRRRA